MQSYRVAYRYRKLWLKDHGKTRDEHRVLMEQKLGRVLSYNEVVHHENEIKTDNRLDNLQLLSRSNHARLHPPPVLRGELSRTAKLTEADVLEIRTSILDPVFLAETYGVHVKTIGKVRRRSTWKHVA